MKEAFWLLERLSKRFVSHIPWHHHFYKLCFLVHLKATTMGLPRYDMLEIFLLHAVEHFMELLREGNRDTTPTMRNRTIGRGNRVMLVIYISVVNQRSFGDRLRLAPASTRPQAVALLVVACRHRSSLASTILE